MSWVGVATAVIGAISVSVSAYSAVAAGENASEVADYNAKVQENAAQDARQRGAVAAAEHQDKVKRMIGTQMATAGANGLLVTTGTPLDIMTDTAGMGKLDSLRLIANAHRQASGLDDQAGLTKVQGANASTAGNLNAAGAIVGGLGSYAKSYYGKGGKD